ncbi:MAG: type IV toxin-antitoxin system AbiEi family antitoxin domain-containing protein [Pseudomonadota bacterium]
MVNSIQKLRKKAFFTTKEAKTCGLSPRMLSYNHKKGAIERIARGIYRFSDQQPASKNLEWQDLAVAAFRIKGAVICLISALRYYEMTDEMMRENWIAVPNNSSRINFLNTRTIRMRNLNLGVKTIELASLKVKIFDEERTLLDSFRLLDQEVALKALKIYMGKKGNRPNLKKIREYSRKLKVDIRQFIAPFLV